MFLNQWIFYQWMRKTHSELHLETNSGFSLMANLLVDMDLVVVPVGQTFSSWSPVIYACFSAYRASEPTQACVRTLSPSFQMPLCFLTVNPQDGKINISLGKKQRWQGERIPAFPVRDEENNNIITCKRRSWGQLIHEYGHLFSGVVPVSFKHAAVKPLLKKNSADHTVLANFRPVSKLPFI